MKISLDKVSPDQKIVNEACISHTVRERINCDGTGSEQDGRIFAESLEAKMASGEDVNTKEELQNYVMRMPQGNKTTDLNVLVKVLAA